MAINAEHQLGNDSRHPHFIWVVLMSAAALILIFVGAFFLVGTKGKKLLAPKHPDPHPTSYLARPGGSDLA